MRGGRSFDAGTTTRDGPASGGGGGDGDDAERWEPCDIDIMSGERTRDRGGPNTLGAVSEVDMAADIERDRSEYSDGMITPCDTSAE